MLLLGGLFFVVFVIMCLIGAPQPVKCSGACNQGRSVCDCQLYRGEAGPCGDSC